MLAENSARVCVREEEQNLAKHALLMVAHWDVLELGGGAQDLQQTTQLGAALERGAKQLDGGVPDVCVMYNACCVLGVSNEQEKKREKREREGRDALK